MYKNKYTGYKKGNILKTPQKNRHKPTLLDGCTDWCVIANIDQQLAFPMEITSTRQHPDLFIWSVNSKKVIIAELMIPFEVNINRAHQHKLEKYEDLWEQCVKNDWLTDIFPFEIGYWGFISNSTSTFINQTLTFPSRKEGIYIKKDQKQDCNCIWVDMAFIWSKHHPNKSGTIVICCWGALG